MTSLTDTAYDIAANAHAGQTRWDGSDYIDHPVRVSTALLTDAAVATALLHDVLEDTNTTAADLEAAGISREVIEAVEALTRRDEETYAEFIERAAGNELARAVKLADLADNLRDLPADHSLRNRYESAVARLEN